MIGYFYSAVSSPFRYLNTYIAPNWIKQNIYDVFERKNTPLPPWGPEKNPNWAIDKNNKRIPKRIVDDLKLNPLPTLKEIRAILPSGKRRFSSPDVLNNPFDFDAKQKFKRARPTLLDQEQAQSLKVRSALLAEFEKSPEKTIRNTRLLIRCAKDKLKQMKEILRLFSAESTDRDVLPEQFFEESEQKFQSMKSKSLKREWTQNLETTKMLLAEFKRLPETTSERVNLAVEVTEMKLRHLKKTLELLLFKLKRKEDSVIVMANDDNGVLVLHPFTSRLGILLDTLKNSPFINHLSGWLAGNKWSDWLSKLGRR